MKRAFAAIAIGAVSTLVLGLMPGGEDTRAKYKRPSAIPYPAHNPFSEAKSELGQRLFFDPILSRGQTVACASCHNPAQSWSDSLPKAVGEARLPLQFRAPTILNNAWTEPLGWDGKFPDLESVAYMPILAPANMNMTEELVNERLQADAHYVAMFRAAFDDGQVNRRNVELALATFQRSIVSKPAPFDRWVEGDDAAIDESAKRGFTLFEGKARCATCHDGWAFTDNSFHDIGTASGNDLGRGNFFKKSTKLQYAFKTPTLRNAADRAPYMHDGSLDTLEKVIDLYDKGGIERPSRSDDIRRLNLTAAEKADLIAFLKTLSSDQ